MIYVLLIIEFELIMKEIFPNFSYEDQFNGKIICGVDEAGRGPLAGPVVAGSVILDREKVIPIEINDSKKLNRKSREKLFDYLVNNHICGIGIVSSEEIDQINILNATKLAMIKSVNELITKPDIILVDGNMTPDFNQESHFIVKGDQKSLSIAAASIIAKVARDKIMTDLSIKYPQYGWGRNAGYGTKQHLEAINKYGHNEYHRMSFAPLKLKKTQLNFF